MTDAVVEYKRTLYKAQFRELMGPSRVTCGCGRSIPVRFAYRCFFCGIWFCRTCAEAHFGERPQHIEMGGEG